MIVVTSRLRGLTDVVSVVSPVLIAVRSLFLLLTAVVSLVSPALTAVRSLFLSIMLFSAVVSALSSPPLVAVSTGLMALSIAPLKLSFTKLSMVVTLSARVRF